MIEIDGSQGEGGGQIVRSSLALSALTGVELKLKNIRGGRKTPGLLRQHLAGLKAMTSICDAHVTGGQLGSQEVTFSPNQVRGGTYQFEVGSAGSAILVAQTVLPALLAADEGSTVTIGGGTHAAWAPPYDFFERCYLPQLAKMRADVSATIESYGFYPAGGGRVTLEIAPMKSGWKGLSLNERLGEPLPRVVAIVSQIPDSIAKRECEVIRKKTGWPSQAFSPLVAESSGGPGNVVMIECGFENTRELFIGFGKKGIRAEQIARGVLKDANQFVAGQVPVGEYLADQLLMPMGIAASSCGCQSSFTTTELSMHSKTHIDILHRFLSVRIRTEPVSDGITRVTVG